MAELPISDRRGRDVVGGVTDTMANAVAAQRDAAQPRLVRRRGSPRRSPLHRAASMMSRSRFPSKSFDLRRRYGRRMGRSGMKRKGRSHLPEGRHASRQRAAAPPRARGGPPPVLVDPSRRRRQPAPSPSSSRPSSSSGSSGSSPSPDAARGSGREAGRTEGCRSASCSRRPSSAGRPPPCARYAEAVEALGLRPPARLRPRARRRPGRPPALARAVRRAHHVPRAVRAVRLPRRVHVDSSWSPASSSSRSARPRSSPSRPPRSTCSPTAASASASASAGTPSSTRPSASRSAPGASASTSRSRCCAGCGPSRRDPRRAPSTR